MSISMPSYRINSMFNVRLIIITLLSKFNWDCFTMKYVVPIQNVIINNTRYYIIMSCYIIQYKISINNVMFLETGEKNQYLHFSSFGLMIYNKNVDIIYFIFSKIQILYDEPTYLYYYYNLWQWLFFRHLKLIIRTRILLLRRFTYSEIHGNRI